MCSLLADISTIKLKLNQFRKEAQSIQFAEFLTIVEETYFSTIKLIEYDEVLGKIPLTKQTFLKINGRVRYQTVKSVNFKIAGNSRSVPFFLLKIA